MEKRFDIYKYISDNKLYPSFVKWSKDHHCRSKYLRMFRFIVHLKKVDELRDPRYDRLDLINVDLIKRDQKSFVDRPSEDFINVVKTRWVL